MTQARESTGASRMRASSLTYAVGDIHGCVDLVRRAFGAIRTHARGRDHTIILLGDYVDRGPNSKEVVEFLVGYRGKAPLVCLRGNHEQMMVEAAHAGSGKLQSRWLAVGGLDTLESYGRSPELPIINRIPAMHLSWAATRPLVFEDADHIFVHAGIDPTRPFYDQGSAEYLWIRERFLSASASDFSDRRHVVHGHTPRWSGKPDAAIPEFLQHRTNLDTGAYDTGVLSVGVFDVDRFRGPVDLLSIL